MTKPWTHKHPYPTNPFQRVCGKELEKLHKKTKKKQPPQSTFEDAPI